MKKVLSLMLVLLLLSVPLTVSAAVNPVSDGADLLTSEEENQLREQLAPYGNGAVCIVTVESLNGVDVEDYAENHAETNHIGVLLVISMAERKWCITSAPEYEGAIDGYVIDAISAECVPYLRADDYYGAFAAFAEQCGYYLEGYDPAASGNMEGSNGFFGRFLICLLIGLAAGGITAGIMAGKNRSVRPRPSAADYVRNGSMVVNVSRDIYLYHHITRTPKPQNNGSHGGGGGSRSTRSGGF